MLSILKKTSALLLTLTITFSQCTISAIAETYDFSNQETVDMSFTDINNTSVSDADFGNFRNVSSAASIQQTELPGQFPQTKKKKKTPYLPY